MRVLDILNLNRRKLNHHEEVYSQGAENLKVWGSPGRIRMWMPLLGSFHHPG